MRNIRSNGGREWSEEFSGVVFIKNFAELCSALKNSDENQSLQCFDGHEVCN
jgi:hypothetical protein